MLVINAEFPIDPERRDDAEALFRDVAEESRAENGVIEYRVGADMEDETLFRFFERYEDEDAFASHGETDHVGDLQEALPGLLAGEAAVTRFEVDSAAPVEL